MPTVLMRGITKRFGSSLACDSIDFDVRRGEIHALLGENGAGKTTLMNILYGFRRRDAGEILVDGVDKSIDSPREAIRQRIGMVHQHFALVPTLTVGDNYSLGREPLMRYYSPSRHVEKTKRVSDEYGLWVDPHEIVAELSVGLQQRVEIIRALTQGVELLILDEPTAVLTPPEIHELLVGLKAFASKGNSVVFITHKLAEVMSVSDRVSVLRRGKLIKTVDTSDITHETLAGMMTGDAVSVAMVRPQLNTGAVVLDVDGITVWNDQKKPAVQDVSFDVREGEIFGIAGVDGNGQAELIEALAGLRPPVQGSISILGQRVPRVSPASMIRAGVGHVPEDRHKWGLFMNLTVADNLVAERHTLEPFSSRGFLNPAAIVKNAAGLIARFSIVPPDPSAMARALSGGNQQKAIVARTFSRNPPIVLANQPTRGLDIGAAQFIHEELLMRRKEGAAVILVAADLDEVLSLSDRVGIMYDGRLVAVVDPRTARREVIGLLMAGGSLAAGPN